MRYLAIAFLLAGCGSDPYTWGDTSLELSEVYCGGQAACGYLGDERVGLCIEHTAWHLCDAD